MQIFFTHNSPEAAAKYLIVKDRRRALKQLLEGIQLLNNVCLAVGVSNRPITQKGVYYMYRNMPRIFQQWIMKSRKNLEWFDTYLRVLSILLSAGSQRRLSSRWPNTFYDNLMCTETLKHKLPDIPRTAFPNYAKNKAKKLDYTNMKPTTLAYKKYLEIQL